MIKSIGLAECGGGGRWSDCAGVEERQNGMQNEYLKEKKKYFLRSTNFKLSSEVKGVILSS